MILSFSSSEGNKTLVTRKFTPFYIIVEWYSTDGDTPKSLGKDMVIPDEMLN